MKISRPVLRFAESAIAFALGFLGIVVALGGPLKIQFAPVWRQLLYYSSLALAATGLVAMLISLIWWIAADLKARRKATPITPMSPR